MGFSARKSFKVLPGVRMTVSRRGVSTSVGGKGLRVTRTASGRVTRTVSLPGTGISHTSSVGGARRGGGSKSSGGAAARRPPAEVTQPAAAARPPIPGLMAPKWEKELYKATVGRQAHLLPQLATSYPQQAPLIATLDGLSAFFEGRTGDALRAWQWAWPQSLIVESDPFVRRYLVGTEFEVEVAAGVTATLPLTRDSVGLALAELHQEAGQLPLAIQVVESLDPSVIAAVSLAELYLEAGHHHEVIALTDGISNTDDPTALLLVVRAALSGVGQHGAAREALKAALASRSRAAAIRHQAYIVRASTYWAEGKKALSRKDLERVLAEDSTYPGLQDALRQADEAGA